MILTPSELKEYCIVCNEVARRSDLSARAKGIYYYLATLPKNWELSQKELLKHFTEGRAALTTAFQELVNTGYIEQKRKQSDKGLFVGYAYKVHWTCQKPDYQKTDFGKPEAQKTDFGQSATNNYLNKQITDLLITEENKKTSYRRFDFLKNYFLENYNEYPVELEEALKEHMSIRDKLKCSKTERSIKAYIKNVENLSNKNIANMVDIINYASDNGWRKCFPKKDLFNYENRRINEAKETKEIKGW